jgi:CDP-diacylglycerol--glycerol-3-phosphate 3-phosphatidyltransferase
MNLPNKLTVARIVLSPVFLVLFFLPSWTGAPRLPITIALIVLFGLMELSDLLDGMIARKQNLVTDLGKVLDPFADVLSRMTYFLCFTGAGLMPVWILAVLIYRELGITFIRTILFRKGIAVPASIWGKGKAVLYSLSGFCGISYIFLSAVMELPGWAKPLLLGIFICAAVASVASFLTYLKPILWRTDPGQ